MIRFAWRNLRRNKRRTYITLVSVIVATFSVSITRFFMYGSHQETIWNAVKMQSGYMQLMAPPYLENPSLENAMDVHPQDWEKMKIKGITEISPRLVSYALIAHQSHSAVGRIFAANPEKEKHITVIHKRVKSGRWIQSSDECAIGSALARKLKVKLGDTISVITSQFDGSLGAANLNVVGIFQSDDYEIDRYFVYVTLEKGKELFRPNEGSSDHSLERYTSIAFGIDKSYRVETIFNQLATNFPLPNTNLEEYYLPVAFFWPDLIPSVVQLMTLDQVSGEITLSFLILIMAFGILNTVQMSIYERKREFGILMALGTKASYLMKIVFLETLFLMGIGMVIGLAFGGSLGFYFEKNPIVLSGEAAKGMMQMGFSPIIPAIVDFREMLIAILTLSIPAIVFVTFSIRKIAHFHPAEVIREA